MSFSYIKHDSIFFVPIIRARLSFAVLVQRAIFELKNVLEEKYKDLIIAVELPDSVKGKTLESIARFPKLGVSIVIARLGESDGDAKDDREVFPVTPCDGIIEAVRIAAEEGIPLHCIDQQIAPGHLVERHCMSIPDWPDDSLALERGAEWYLNLIQEHVSYPPMRIEPVDTWREIYMANKLRLLHTRYRRGPILFVCDATHVKPIRKFLQDPHLLTDLEMETSSKLKLDIARPNLSVLLRYYLDDMPKLVEIYEQHRKQGKAKDFNKWSVLINAIHQAEEKAGDIRFSVRQHQAFTQFLRNLTENAHRVSPELEQVLVAADSCFNKRFSEQIRRHLLSYCNQVKVDHIGRPIPSDTDDRTTQYTARSCNPRQQMYEIVRVPWDRKEREEKDLSNTLWPPYKRFMNRMRQRAQHIAGSEGERIVSTEFRGSIETGIDLRATLKSHLEATIKRRPGIASRLYVKRRLTSRAADINKREPVVWLIDPGQKEKPQAVKLVFGIYGGPEYISEWSFCLSRVLMDESKDEKVKVHYRKKVGMISFCEAAITLENIQRQYGAEFKRRIPRQDDFQDSMLSAIAAQALKGSPWWELLLLGAMNYAKEVIPYVAPIEFSVPIDVIAAAKAQQKFFYHIPLPNFSPDEQKELEDLYTMDFPYFIPKGTDINDPEYLLLLERRFGGIMSQVLRAGK